MSVSLLTITQHARIPFFMMCARNVATQSYKDMKEWVIVNGTPGATQSDSNAFFKIITSILTKLNIQIPVKCIHNPSKKTIGGLRNLANSMSTGDILIWIDDDDYYGPNYIQHVLDTLNKSSYELAGCINPYYYDLTWKCTFQYTKGNPNLSTNNCLSYKRSYLDKQHRYDETVQYGEEYAFTDKLTQPIAHLDPVQSQFVGLSHPWNMCSKSLIHLCAHYGLHELLNHVPGATVLPKEVIEGYESILGPPGQCPYDIVYYTGGFSDREWSPEQEDLGGSEQAVVELAKQWASMGKKVAVYGYFPFTEKRISNIDYIHSGMFHLHQVFDVLILWRIYGAWPVLNSEVNVSANTLLLDLHDPIEAGEYRFHETICKYANRYPTCKFMFKSNTHLEGYSKLLSKKAWTHIIPNGIRESFYKSDPGIPRIPLRFCYCSAYERGLISILVNVWPHIVKEEPTAELHIYYGCKDDSVLEIVQKAIQNTFNVMDHGRRGMQEIIREKRMSSFHLYPTNVPAETDCISLKESCALGCIPIAIQKGLFLEREAFFVEGDPDTEEGGKCIAEQILTVAKDSTKLSELQQKLMHSSMLLPWSSIATSWLNVLNSEPIV